MNTELTLNSLLNRAMISRGARRVQDLTEALKLAREAAGTPSQHNLTARNDLSPGYHQPEATNRLSLVDTLRAMLEDDGIKGNPRASAKIARLLNELR